MSKPKKVYVHLGDLVHLMIVPECFSRDASGYREQLYPQSVLIRLHDTDRVALGGPFTRLVQWDGSDFPSRSAPAPVDGESIARAALEAASVMAKDMGGPTPQHLFDKGFVCAANNIAAAIRAAANDPATLAAIVKGDGE